MPASTWTGHLLHHPSPHLLQDLGRGRCHCASPSLRHHHLHVPPHNHLWALSPTTLNSTLTPTVRLRTKDCRRLFWRRGSTVLGHADSAATFVFTFVITSGEAKPTHNMQIQHLKKHLAYNESESIKLRARDKVRGQNTGQGQK